MFIALELIQNSITDRITFTNQCLSVALIICGGEKSPRAVPHFNQLISLYICAIGFLNRRIAAFSKKINNILGFVAQPEMHAMVDKIITERRFRESAIDWNQHRLIIL